MEIKDLLGIEPIGQAALEVTRSTIDGVSSFLNVVCKPGLEEFGFLIRDSVRKWRLTNIIKMLDKAKGRLGFDGKELHVFANPRVCLSIMEGCSEVDNNDLQDLWAGLFVSSCTPDGRDDSNMNFVDLLRRMSSVEAKIVDYACTHCKKILFPNNLILADGLKVSFSVLTGITGITDIYRLDNELDHMRSLELLSSGVFASAGFNASDTELDADITPSALALSLYYKTHSQCLSPVEFWGDSLSSASDIKLKKKPATK